MRTSRPIARTQSNTVGESAFKDNDILKPKTLSCPNKSGSTWGVSSEDMTVNSRLSPMPIRREDSAGTGLTVRRTPASTADIPFKSRSFSRSRDTFDESYLNGIRIIEEHDDYDDDESTNGHSFDEISFHYSPNCSHSRQHSPNGSVHSIHDSANGSPNGSNYGGSMHGSQRSLSPFGSKYSLKSLSEVNLNSSKNTSYYLKVSREDEEVSEITYDDRSGYYSAHYPGAPVPTVVKKSSPKHAQGPGKGPPTGDSAWLNIHDPVAEGAGSHHQYRQNNVTGELMEVLDGIAEGDCLSNSQASCSITDVYPSFVSEVDCKKHKDIPLTVGMTERRSAQHCLTSKQAEELKIRSLKDSRALIGWQIQLLKPDANTCIGVGVITDVQKDVLSRKSQYRVSSLDPPDFWMKLKKADGKQGVEFRPLRQVFRVEKHGMIEIDGAESQSTVAGEGGTPRRSSKTSCRRYSAPN